MLLTAFALLATVTQTCPTVTLERELPSPCSGVTMTARHDARDRPFLYVAAKEAGLKIYRDDGPAVPARTIGGAALGSLDVMNLAQSGDYLYLALGNHFSANENPGFAIVDVRDPARASVVALWREPSLRGGAGAIEVEGSRVYLAAMGNGLFVFDAADARRPSLLSRFVPEAAFPDARPDRAKVNARGLTVRGGRVYLSYDAGGLRVLDARDARDIREVGRYANPALNGKPRAYNNAVLDGDLLYVAVDYCGVEVLDVSNPSRITLAGWWNPWGCEAGGLRWFTSDGHANEIAFDAAKKLLFVSTGESDLHVLDVANPRRPALREIFGGVDNKIGTWGVSIHRGRVYLAYICTLGIPFESRWSGIKVLSYR